MVKMINKDIITPVDTSKAKSKGSKSMSGGRKRGQMKAAAKKIGYK